MTEENHILFFDLEVHPQNGGILEIGALLDGRSFSGSNLYSFQTFSASARLFCGHNIFDHDLPALRRNDLESSFFQKGIVDTLFGSALLFPRKPYHRLVKDYQLDGTQLNNPLADARLSRDLLGDLLEAFHGLPAFLKTLYVSLLGEAPVFNGFFQLVRREALPISLSTNALIALYEQQFSDSYCRRTDLGAIIAQNPVELAYATAIISTEDPSSLPPSWILHRFPEVQRIINRLRVACDGQAGCPYCRRLQPCEGLRRLFGFDGFRRFEGDDAQTLQEQVVEAVHCWPFFRPVATNRSLSNYLP